MEELTTPFCIDKPTVMARKGSRVWHFHVARFLRKYVPGSELEPPDWGALEFNLTTQGFVLHEGVLYFCKNYNMHDDDYYVNDGGEEGVYRVERSSRRRFDIVLTRLEPFDEPVKGRRHPTNAYPRDHPCALDGALYRSLLDAFYRPDGKVGLPVDDHPILAELRDRYEDRPFAEGSLLRLWWVRSSWPRYFVKFMDAEKVESPGTLPKLSFGPNAVYQQTPHADPSRDREYYFERVKR